MANPRYNTQVANRRGAMNGGRMKKMGGGMMMKRPMMRQGGDMKKDMIKKVLKTAGKAAGVTPVGGVVRAAKAVTKKIKEKRMKKMGGGMMKRPMMREGGKLKMVMKGGKKVPFFAADGKGAKDLGKATGMKKGKGVAAAAKAVAKKIREKR